jgi:6-phosphogluconolactonase
VKHFELIRFTNDRELAKAVAAAWGNEIEAARRNKAQQCVALSGGRIARRLFSAAAQHAAANKLTLDSVHFFWADERCVPPSDPESNFQVARELLFAPLQIPEEQIHRVQGEEPRDVAAAEAETKICRIAQLNSDGQPVLDLIFLGMGEDGHVASLFPGEPESVMSDPAVYRAVTAGKPPPQRITIGYKTIAAARQVWVLASGPGKETALRNSLSLSEQTPLARVLKSRTFTKIFTDIPFE